MYKDAIYFSPHKFVGGVDSPGKVNGILLVVPIYPITTHNIIKQKRLTKSNKMRSSLI